MLTSDVSRATGASMSTAIYYGNGWWWLRSPDYNSSSDACYVGSSGYADSNYNVNYDHYGVVPALNLTLS